MARVSLENVVKKYGQNTVVDHVDLAINEGEFVTLLGPSGCGKTTCLRMIAGFVTPDAGRVRIGGDDVTHIAPYRRETGMVFQQYALFPHLTVAQNLAFGLKLRKLSRQEVATRVREALGMVRLEAFAERYPSELSGGQKQRVALARAIVINPRVLLLDEPLGALDQQLREELQAELKRIQQTVGITTLFVTHDQHEALALSDRIVVMRQGRISQIGTPQDIYRHPRSRYVADFIGKANFIDVVVQDLQTGLSENKPQQRATVRHIGSDQCFIVDVRDAPITRGEHYSLSLRPEALVPGAQGNSIAAEVLSSTYVGNGWQLKVATPLGLDLTIRTNDITAPRAGDRLTLGWLPGDATLLPLEDAPFPGEATSITEESAHARAA